MDDSDVKIVEYNYNYSSNSFHRSCWQRISSCCVNASRFFDTFSELRKSPRCLIAIYLVAFLDSLSYYAFSYALIMHLGLEMGLPDSLAGLFYGIFGICISVSVIVLGFAADWLGVRPSICLSAAIAFMARLAMAYAVLAQSVTVSAIALFLFIAPSTALIGPPIPTAIKRYTTDSSRDLAFTIYYGIMNVAAFIATPVVDVLRLGTQEDVLLLPPYALLIAATGVAQMPIFFIAMFWVSNVKLQNDGSVIPYVPPDNKKGIKERIRVVLSQDGFWRALVIVSCLIGVRSSFRYLDALYLPYVMRAFQDATTFPYMTLVAINPIIVISCTLTGVVTIVTKRVQPINALIIGSFIGGMAPFWMGFGPYVWCIIMYIVWTSIGEIIWSPMSYSYLVSLTSDGDEGAFMALAGMPTFLAKMLTGTLTGMLLTNFCPDSKALCQATPPKVHCEMVNGTLIGPGPPPPQFGGTPGRCNAFGIWFIIGLTTITSFFALMFFKKYLEKPQARAVIESETLTSQQSINNEE